MIMFKGQPKKMRAVGYPGVLKWGEVFGGYNGVGFSHEVEELTGPLVTELSLRRIRRRETNADELQMTLDVIKRYNSGANSRRAYGAMTMHGEMLAEFIARVLFRDDNRDALDTAKAVLKNWDASRSSYQSAVADSLRTLLEAIEPKG